ncbi:MAG: tetratricopeptide repeat protein [Dehalococcoidia bacterium]
MGTDDTRSFPERLKQFRARLGLSQVKLAALLGVSSLSIIRWEHGRTRPPSQLVARLERLESGGLNALSGIEGASQDQSATAGDAPVDVPAALAAVQTELVGRGRELAELTRLLRETRLVTIWGPGGCGKTRLALALMQRLRTSFLGGVVVVELAAVVAPEQAPLATALAAGVPLQPEQTLVRRLAARLGAQPTLLLLDNCEHLQAAAAALAGDLLGAAPALRIIATSREPLHLPDERAWQAPPLTLPSADPRPRLSAAETPATVAARAEAVQLFVRRAATAQPGFALTDANAGTVVEICRRLDGLPLAIELAAARVQLLSVAQIAARLDDRFRLLGGGEAAAPRHRTLEAAVDWSFALLDPAEQRLFCRLGLFAAGFGIEAVEALAPRTDSYGEPAMSVLSRLVDRSMVRVERGPADEPRYRLLESLRAFARERLSERDDERQAAEQFADFSVEVALQAEAELTGPEQHACLLHLDREWPNLRAALAGLEAGGSGESIAMLRLASALWRFWYLRGYLSEGRHWLESALGQSETARAVIRAKALNALAWLAKEQRDFTAAQAWLEQAVVLWQAADDTPGLAAAYSGLGSVAYEQADLVTARRCYDRSLAIYRALGDRHNVAILLNNVGQAMPIAEQAAAVPLYAESLAICRAVGERYGMVPALNNLGLAAYQARDFSGARRFYAEGLGVCRVLNYRYGEALLLANLGHVALAEGDRTAARTRQAQSLLRMREVGHDAGIVHALRSLAAVDAAEGNLRRAAQRRAAAAALAGDVPVPVPPAYLAEAAATELAIQTGLTADQQAEYRGEGAAMTLDQIADEAAREAAAAEPSAGMPEAGARTAERGTAGQAARAGHAAELSAREQDVLRLIVEGRSNRQIAQTLVLSVRTVEHHVAAVHAKLGTQSRTELVARALTR